MENYNTKILSLKGGGIKGVRTLVVLRDLESRTGKKCHELFDYITGTSVGAIIASMLASGYSAQEILNIITEKADNIFSKPWYRFGLFRSKYSDQELNLLLFHYLGNKPMFETDCKLLIPTYNLDKRVTKIFKSWDAKVLLRDVVRASASAQSYFKPHEISGYRFIDGGNVINNPSLMAIIEAHDFESAVNKMEKRFTVVSVGTGVKEQAVKDFKNGGGKLQWAEPTVDILLDEQSQTVDYYLHGISKIVNSTIYQIEPTVKWGSDAIDDASEQNIASLIEDGYQTVKKYGKLLSKIALEL